MRPQYEPNERHWGNRLERLALTLPCPSCPCGVEGMPCGPFPDPVCFDRITSAGLLDLSAGLNPNRSAPVHEQHPEH